MIIRDRGELDRENAQVLNLVQAMLGGVTPNLWAVSVECHDTAATLHFLLSCDDPTEWEAIEDIVFEFEALQVGAFEVEVCVVVTSETRTQLLPGRPVFRRKEQAEESDSDEVDT